MRKSLHTAGIAIFVVAGEVAATSTAFSADKANLTQQEKLPASVSSDFVACSGPLSRACYLESLPPQSRHFLDEENHACDVPTDELLARVRDQAEKIEERFQTAGLDTGLEDLYRETLNWHYPHRGDLSGVEEFFCLKVAWAMMLLSNHERARDIDYVELTLAPLQELREWRMPHPHYFPYPEQPGNDILRAAGVESFDELTDDIQRTAWQKEVEDAATARRLGHLQKVLEQLDEQLTSELWYCYKRGVRDARQANDTSLLARWKDFNRRLNRQSCPSDDWDEWWKY